MSTEITRLCNEWQFYKTQEQDAKNKRVAVEDALVYHAPEIEEGTNHLDSEHYKVTVSHKLNRKLDYEAYQAIEGSLPEGVRCVDLKPAINLKKLRALEMVDPNLSAQFITTSPAKPSVKIEEKQ